MLGAADHHADHHRRAGERAEWVQVPAMLASGLILDPETDLHTCTTAHIHITHTDIRSNKYTTSRVSAGK